MRNAITIMGLVVMSLCSRSDGTVIADSVAEFSGVQGQSNWYYGYWDRTSDADHVYAPSEFVLMSQYLTTPSMDYGPSLHVPCWRVQDGSYWTALWNTGGHPNGTNGNAGHLPIEHWTIRRWVSEVSGTIDISGLLGCSDGFQCNINGRILIDGASVYSYLVPSGQSPQSYSVSMSVNAGSFVDFMIDSNGVDYNDMTYFTASITPEPSSAAIFGSLLCLAVTLKRARMSSSDPSTICW